MKEIKKIGVVGAGQMGAGIAQVAAQSGFETYLWDANSEACKKGIQFIHGHLARLVEKEKITKAEEEKAKANLKACNSLNEFSSVDLAIEAIIENTEIKKKLFKELDVILDKSSIIASNTSSISITLLASSTSRADKFIGMHFMNPVPLMKLVEVIPGLQTESDTLLSTENVVRKMNKTVVKAKDTPGFIVNRILVPMVNEAIFLLQEGNSPQDIDNAMVLGTNQPMGPLALADLVGLDTLLYIAQLLHRELGEDKYRPSPLLVKYVEAGWYGRKTKRGFYQY